MNWNSPTSMMLGQSNRLMIDPEEVRHLYWDERLSIPNIAERLEVAHGTIWNIMCRYEIPRRSVSEANALVLAKRLEGRDKAYKFCPKCQVLKPVGEFFLSRAAYDGLQGYCKKCIRESYLGTRERHYSGLHKRPYPIDNNCEICGMQLGKCDYHHFNDDNPSLGFWVCGSCDYLAEGLDEIDKNPWKVNIYRRLKREVEEVEMGFKYLGPFLPPNNIRRLYSPNGDLIYKWCAHCGLMKPVDKFNKNRYNKYGLCSWCKRCFQSYTIGYAGKPFYGLHKRPKPDCCELCGNKVDVGYHHWEDSNKSKGVWICNTNKCHYLAGAVDRLDNDSSLPNKYLKLKREMR